MSEQEFGTLYQQMNQQFANQDPELFKIWTQFSIEQVQQEQELDELTQAITTVALLLGSYAVDEFENASERLLIKGIAPEVIQEVVYQAVPYLGIGRVKPFLLALHAVFERQKINTPLTTRSQVETQTRFEKGVEAQVAIFGPHMKEFSETGPNITKHIRQWLVSNCFGDYYTRRGLDYKQRELVTLCYLAAQGGCEPQLKSHIHANLRLGNYKELLIAILSQAVPYIGYPRVLNAIDCIQSVVDESVAKEKQIPYLSAFPIGEANVKFAKYFTGESFLHMLSIQQITVANVTFAPKCRNYWHIHHAKSGGGQILIVTAGEGYYQEWGKPVRKLVAGDVVNIPAGVKHWHGASDSQWFQHLAIEVAGEETSNEWFEALGDEAYAELTK